MAIANAHEAAGCSQTQARIQARLITQFWRDKGYTTVHAHVVDVGGTYVVRSNLINGMPPRR